MIGNDIVDWEQARRESNWQRKGFLDKLFTAEEQRLINQASQPEQMVWTLWSLKESVYKANVRQTGKRRFAPRKISCQLQACCEHTVTGFAYYYDYTYTIRASLTQHYVSSTAVDAGVSSNFQAVITSFVNDSYTHQSSHLRAFISKYVVSNASTDINTLTIQKDAVGIPNLIIEYKHAQWVTVPISLSHHGYYGAFLTSL